MQRYSGITDKITSEGLAAVRNAVANGSVAVSIVEVKEAQRLDHIAHEYYGDGTMWWIIAAASGIGWWLQVPPGTLLKVPITLDGILA